jgi:hypothetical protein
MTGDFVPLREHLERLLADQSKYFERLLTDHDRHHDRDREATNRAIDEARDRIDTRLGQLNELRSEVTKDRGLLVQRNLFDARMEAQDTAIDNIAKEQASQRGRQAAYAIVLGIALVLVPLIIQLLIR